MPLDLKRLSRRRAQSEPTPSEEFTKHRGADEVSVHASSEILRKGFDDDESQNVEPNQEGQSGFSCEDNYSTDIGVNGINNDNESNLGYNDYIDEGDDGDFNGIGDDNESNLGYNDYIDESHDSINLIGDNNVSYDIDGSADENAEETFKHYNDKVDEYTLDEPYGTLEHSPMFVGSNHEQPTIHDDEVPFTPILTDEETEALLNAPLPEEEKQVLLDNAKPERKFMFTPTPLVEEAKLNQSFSYTIETFAIEVMNASEITNVSLSSFGDVSLIYEPDRLSLLKIGKHKFVGRPLSPLDKQRLFYTLNEFLRKCGEEGKDSVTIKLTQRVFYRGVPYTSLVAVESELSEYAGIFGKTVYFNPDEPDELNLVAVIKCKE